MDNIINTNMKTIKFLPNNNILLNNKTLLTKIELRLIMMKFSTGALNYYGGWRL